MKLTAADIRYFARAQFTYTLTATADTTADWREQIARENDAGEAMALVDIVDLCVAARATATLRNEGGEAGTVAADGSVEWWGEP